MKVSALLIAISGSSGLIGSNLAESLQSSGHEVVALRRTNAGGARKEQKSENGFWGGGEASTAVSIPWDPKSGLLNPSDLSGFDAFVHLAGKNIASGPWTKRMKNEIRESRIQPTRTLAQQLAKLQNPPKRVLSASAIGIYGDRGDEQLSEDAAPGTGFLADLAQRWEMCCDPLREADIQVVHPRLGMVLSSQGGALASMLRLFRWGLGGRLGRGRQYWSWISLDDCIAAIIWLLQSHEITGAFNLVSPKPVSNVEFTESLGRILKRPTFLPVPEFGLKLVLGEMVDEILLGSCRAVPTRLVTGGFRFQHQELCDFLSAEC